MEKWAFCKCTKSMKKIIQKKKEIESPDSLVYEEHSHHVAHKFLRFSRQKIASVLR